MLEAKELMKKLAEVDASGNRAEMECLVDAALELADTYVLGILSACIAGGRPKDLPEDEQARSDKACVDQAKRILELVSESKKPEPAKPYDGPPVTIPFK